MAVKKQDWELSQRGMKDAARHREKVRDAIRGNIADIISEESIITRKEGQIVKVPIRGLKSYQFIYRRGSSGGSASARGRGKKGTPSAASPPRTDRPDRPATRRGWIISRPRSRSKS